MADFNLTQTDQQVQNILNDAQGAMGAGAQTTLTTEYVMLKDTNGVYHKILKSSFTEAIRDVLAGLLVNNDKGTTISQIAAIASGDFGSITPANLASVLGGLYPHVRDNSTDFNDLTTTGVYLVGTSNGNRPSGTSNILMSVIVIRISSANSDSGILQFATKWTGNDTIYFRSHMEAQDTWREWKKIDFSPIE